MRHRRKGRVLGRSPSHQRALLRNLASALFLTEREPEEDEENPPKVKGRIVTTIQKAKEARPVVERAITVAIRSLKHAENAQTYSPPLGDNGKPVRNSEPFIAWRKSADYPKWRQAMAPVVKARRRVFALLRDNQATRLCFEAVAPRFVGRPGGYTRIVRLAQPRLGTQAPVPFLSLSVSEIEWWKRPRHRKLRPNRLRRPERDVRDAWLNRARLNCDCAKSIRSEHTPCVDQSQAPPNGCLLATSKTANYHFCCRLSEQRAPHIRWLEGLHPRSSSSRYSMHRTSLVIVAVLFICIGKASADNAQDCLAAHNRIRRSEGLRPLQLDKRLCQAAQKHAEYMAGRCKLDHRGPGDEMYAERARAAGYQTDWANASENIAEGPVDFMDADFTTNAWLESKVGHKDNVLSREWRFLGVGVARGRDDRLYWCAVYARPDGAVTTSRSTAGL